MKRTNEQIEAQVENVVRSITAHNPPASPLAAEFVRNTFPFLIREVEDFDIVASHDDRIVVSGLMISGLLCGLFARHPSSIGILPSITHEASARAITSIIAIHTGQVDLKKRDEGK